MERHGCPSGTVALALPRGEFVGTGMGLFELLVFPAQGFGAGLNAREVI